MFPSIRNTNRLKLLHVSTFKFGRPQNQLPRERNPEIALQSPATPCPSPHFAAIEIPDPNNDLQNPEGVRKSCVISTRGDANSTCRLFSGIFFRATARNSPASTSTYFTSYSVTDWREALPNTPELKRDRAGGRVAEDSSVGQQPGHYWKKNISGEPEEESYDEHHD
jgi:hypothetical protein